MSQDSYVSPQERLEQEVRAAVAQTRGMLGLFYAVRDNFDLVARLSAEQRLRLLNRFGDSEAPWNMKGVWAWDDTEVLVLTGQGRDSLELIRRQHWES